MAMHEPSLSKQGFSLVELSIVLVILGLLVGGIMTGQNLIRAAELRSITTQLNEYQTAVNIFQEEYLGLPGDLENAARYWGARDGGDGEGSDCFNVEATGTETCNGNSDGDIHLVEGTTAGVENWCWGERFTFWQHLANAGLISGKYTGRTDSTTSAFALTGGKNVPAGKISSAMWDVNGRKAAFPGSTDRFPDNGGLMLVYRSEMNTARSPLNAGEVWQIDKKIDDEKPGRGMVRTFKATSPSAPGCSTTDDFNTAEYAVDYTDTLCNFTVIVPF